ncbi:hypothetical protein G6F22_016386 [Rhizopus arrhizus]|nr:hypothetical protein G6F22_016386 [Rhizopus arrhizus]
MPSRAIWHSAGRRRRRTAASGDAGGQQTTAAGLRQADGLLPPHHVDAGGHPRHPDHLDAARHAAVPAVAGRRLAVGHGHPVRGAAQPRWPGAGLSDRPRLRGWQTELPGAGRQHLPRDRPARGAQARRPARRRCHGVRLLGE